MSQEGSGGFRRARRRDQEGEGERRRGGGGETPLKMVPQAIDSFRDVFIEETIEIH